MTDPFAETLLRGDDVAAQRLAETTEHRSALAEKRALDGLGATPDGAPRGPLAGYFRMRAACVAPDRAALEALARSATEPIAQLAAAWASHLAGGSTRPFAASDAMERGGADPLSIALEVDALVLEAWTPAASGVLEHAVAPRELALVRDAAALASRADQPHAQYLAYAALGRARRRMGRIPMATRLFASLLRTAPPPYRAWLAWEARLVGLREVRSLAVDALDEALAAARAGDRLRFERARDSLLAHAEASVTLRAESQALLAAVDPALPLTSLDLQTRAFVSGAVPQLGGGLEGAGIDPSSPDEPIACALVDAAGVRRVLAAGVGLASRRAHLEISEHGGRTETAIVTLASATDGMDDDVFFRAVYGFTFKKLLHDGVLRVLLTRMRQALEPHATLEREPRLHLVVRAPFVLVDPRVSSRADNAVLRAIASERAVSAKELAERTGLPLRTVQAELARLLDEGVCKKSKDGRSTEYLVEDTVIREPSRVITSRDLMP